MMEGRRKGELREPGNGAGGESEQGHYKSAAKRGSLRVLCAFFLFCLCTEQTRARRLCILRLLMLPSFLGGMCAVQARAWGVARGNEGNAGETMTRQFLLGGWLAKARSNFNKKGRGSRKEVERQVRTASERCCFSTKSNVILTALMCTLACQEDRKSNSCCADCD